jgi:hypothetical protein
MFFKSLKNDIILIKINKNKKLDWVFSVLRSLLFDDSATFEPCGFEKSNRVLEILDLFCHFL